MHWSGYSVYVFCYKKKGAPYSTGPRVVPRPPPNSAPATPNRTTNQFKMTSENWYGFASQWDMTNDARSTTASF